MRRLLIGLCWLVLVMPVRAASIEGTLVRAANEKVATDDRLKDIEPKLKRVFGYRSYRQLGRAKKAITGHDEIGLNLGEGFTLFLRPTKVTGKKHEFNAEMYSGKALIVKQEKLAIAKKGHVFIKGPEVGNTLLLVVITVTE